MASSLNPVAVIVIVALSSGFGGPAGVLDGGVVAVGAAVDPQPQHAIARRNPAIDNGCRNARRLRVAEWLSGGVNGHTFILLKVDRGAAFFRHSGRVAHNVLARS